MESKIQCDHCKKWFESKDITEYVDGLWIQMQLCKKCIKLTKK